MVALVLAVAQLVGNTCEHKFMFSLLQKGGKNGVQDCGRTHTGDSRQDKVWAMEYLCV